MLTWIACASPLDLPVHRLIPGVSEDKLKREFAKNEFRRMENEVSSLYNQL